MAKQWEPKKINLALQGGGSHGALTWGVLDALLEDGRFALDGISGTSAGAMNAVAVAHGFAVAAQQHQDARDAHEAGCALARQTLKSLWEGVGGLGGLMWSVPLPGMNVLLDMMTQWLSPYQLNPLGINPLRQLLRREINFDLLGASPAGCPQVFICATNVRTGRGEIFSNADLSVDSVMASACLPQAFKAVQINGEYYWDGGYGGNPALHPLTYHTKTCDILLVQINPIEHTKLPDNAEEIINRVNDITFNASLLAEIRAIEFVRRLLAEGKLDEKRYKSLRLHRIDGGALLEPFSSASKLRADLGFLRQLCELGRDAGALWLQTHAADVGKRPTIDLVEHR